MFYNKPKRIKYFKYSSGNFFDTISLYDIAYTSLLSLVTKYFIISVAISDSPQDISPVSIY